MEGCLIWIAWQWPTFACKKHTIIGAGSFHGPVRDGKGWFQTAMAAKHNWYHWCFWLFSRVHQQKCCVAVSFSWGVCNKLEEVKSTMSTHRIKLGYWLHYLTLEQPLIFEFAFHVLHFTFSRLLLQIYLLTTAVITFTVTQLFQVLRL